MELYRINFFRGIFKTFCFPKILSMFSSLWDLCTFLNKDTKMWYLPFPLASRTLKAKIPAQLGKFLCPILPSPNSTPPRDFYSYCSFPWSAIWVSYLYSYHFVSTCFCYKVTQSIYGISGIKISSVSTLILSITRKMHTNIWSNFLV